MNKKRFIIVFSGLMILINITAKHFCVCAEELPPAKESQSATNPSEGTPVAETPSPKQIQPQGESSESEKKPAEPQKPEKKPDTSSDETEKKKKQPAKKAKKAVQPVEKKVEEPVSQEKPPVQTRINLPDISDNTYHNGNNAVATVYLSKKPEEKLIKGVISWAMIFSGIGLIIWVIIKNRKIPKDSSKFVNGRKSNKISRKKRLYYKKSHRK